MSFGPKTLRLSDLDLVGDDELSGTLHYFDPERNIDLQLPVSKLLIDGGDTAALAAALATKDGLKNIGFCPDIATLRATEPTIPGQQMDVLEYNAGSGVGGDRFVYDDKNTSSADDGGVYFVTPGGKRWRRKKSPLALDVFDFGAVGDAVTDDMPAFIRMYNYTYTLPTARPIGIILPPGKFAVSSTFDLSGAAEQALFRITGPRVAYGVVPQTEIVPTDATSTVPMFQVNARRTEITGITLAHSGTVPFFTNNCPRGEYVRISCICANNMGGLAFKVVDTIDTLLDQCYVYSCSGGFFETSWSNGNPGVWDHPTAIEIRNCNFSSNKVTEVLKMMRAGQSIMRNVWFSNNEFTYDISQGGWLFDTVIMENSTNPAKTQYAKVVRINCRFAQGAGEDNTLSGYLPEMDSPAGAIPSWVTAFQDQGTVDINVQGCLFDTGLGSRFTYPFATFNQPDWTGRWIEVGTVSFTENARTAQIRLVGNAGWNSVGPTIDRPGSTGFAGGEAIIFVQFHSRNTETTTLVEAHWQSTGSSPISAVRVRHSWGAITVYAFINQYAARTGMFVEMVDLPRSQAGTPCTVKLTGTAVPDINAIDGLLTAPCRWMISNGSYQGNGFGMDIDNGILIFGSNGVKTVGGVVHNPIKVNGTQHYLHTSTKLGLAEGYEYTFANLPDPTTSKACKAFCSNTGKTTAYQEVYSDGTNWRYVADPDTIVTSA